MGNFIEINGLPFVACLLVSGILVYLGMHVVERKVIFVDLALAQIAALGVMWAILMGWNHEEDTLAVTLYSLAFTVVGALVFSITRTKNDRVPHEALIGIIYVTATAAGLVLADRFALGTEALKELIAGRVALVTTGIVIKLAVTCAAVGVVLFALHGRLLRISVDPQKAEESGTNLRLWDFAFYLLFGVVITQTVSVLGVLPVFAYLVIPAVAAAFLFESVRSRLIFGWLFAGVISLVGLETARMSRLDPGPTIVCLFAAALVLLGVVLYARGRGFRRKALIRVVAFAAVFAGFLGATFAFKKEVPTDELATAMDIARSGDSTSMRKAMQSFRRFPGQQQRWIPVVESMLTHEDEVVREEAATLLGEMRADSATKALIGRLDIETEEDDVVREVAVGALAKIGDPAAFEPLVQAATEEEEPDIAVQMCDAALGIAKDKTGDELRGLVDILADIAGDEDAPQAAQRDALERLRDLTDTAGAAGDDAAALSAWWKQHRDTAVWDPGKKRFTAPPSPTPNGDAGP